MEVSIREAAQIIGRSTRTVRNMAQSGRIKARRVGDRWMVDRESLNTLSGLAPDARRTQVAEFREKLNACVVHSLQSNPELIGFPIPRARRAACVSPGCEPGEEPSRP